MCKDKPNTTENDQKPHPMKTIRIFISSPGDVAVERERAKRVVESLRKRYAGRLALETVLWEYLPLGGGGLVPVRDRTRLATRSLLLEISRFGRHNHAENTNCC